MRTNWKFLGLAVVPVLVLVCSGCSGINQSGSVSPATILPYLLRADPPPAAPEGALPADDAGPNVALL